MPAGTIDPALADFGRLWLVSAELGLVHPAVADFGRLHHMLLSNPHIGIQAAAQPIPHARGKLLSNLDHAIMYRASAGGHEARLLAYR